jgi:hypothetical protein
MGCSDSAVSPTMPDTIVTLQTVNPPAIVAFRDETSKDWKTLPVAGTSRFDLHVTGPYRVAVGCEPGETATVLTQYARTPDDGDSIQYECSSDAPLVDLHGRMSESGAVSLGLYEDDSTGGDWEFDLPAVPGTFDLIMRSGDFTVAFDRIAIRREFTVRSDANLGTINFSLEHSEPLVPTVVTIQNALPGETTTFAASFQTGTTSISMSSSRLAGDAGWTAGFVPESVLRPTDRQMVAVTAHEAQSEATMPQHYRVAGRDVHVGDPTLVTLPDPLAPVMFEKSANRLTATWSALPEYDELTLHRHSSSLTDKGPKLRAHELRLSRRFIDALSVTSMALDLSDIPGITTDWQLEPTSQACALQVTHGPNTGFTTTGVRELLQATTPTMMEWPSGEHALMRRGR